VNGATRRSTKSLAAHAVEGEDPKNMKRKWTKPVVAIAALSLVAAACGGDDDDAGSDEPAESTADEGTADEGTADEGTADEGTADEGTADEGTADEGTADAGTGDSLMDGAIPCEGQHEGKTVTILSPARDSENDNTVVSDYVAGYDPLAECTGVTIEWQPTDQFETEINVRLQGGDPPDIIDYPQPGLMIGHARADYLQPLPDDLAGFVTENFPEGLVVAGTVDEVQYGLPARTNVKSLVWYSPPAFAEAGYEVPTTLEGLTELSDQIVADGGVPWCIGAESGVATGWVITDWLEDFMMRYHGGEVYDQWTTHEIPFNDAQVVEAVDAVGAFVKNPDYLGGENNVKAIATTKFQDGGSGVATGDCFMHRQANFYKSLWPEGTVVAPDGDIWLFQLPSLEGQPSAMLVGGDIYVAGTDKPESWDVLRYTGSTDYQLHEINTRSDLGANVNIDLSAIDDTFIQTMTEWQNASEIVRFDGTDIMPGAVGSGSIWTEITAWVIGGDTQTFVDNVENSWPAS
jgi:alpha-glucoside transport system substrate-binding protein